MRIEQPYLKCASWFRYPHPKEKKPLCLSQQRERERERERERGEREQWLPHFNFHLVKKIFFVIFIVMSIQFCWNVYFCICTCYICIFYALYFANTWLMIHLHLEGIKRTVMVWFTIHEKLWVMDSISLSLFLSLWSCIVIFVFFRLMYAVCL